MRTLIAGVLAAMVLSTSPVDVRATTFVVNSDVDGAPGPCESTIGGCTLREAILAAVATPGRDTIRFDPRVFPLGRTNYLDVDSALPVIADAAGTVIDGAGASVLIAFMPPSGGGNPVDGLVFASAPGVALAKATVANLSVRFFSGSGIVFCGGTPPGCDDDLSNVVVQNVVASQNGVHGIKLDGRADAKIEIVDSVASYNGASGLAGNGGQSLAGLRVARCTAYANAESGFTFNAGGETAGTVISDSIAVQNGGGGFDVNAGKRTTKTKLANIAARGNGGSGVGVTAGSEVAGVAIANALVTANTGTGIDVSAGDLVTSAALKDVASNNNGGYGVYLSSGGTVSAATITRAVAAGNESSGIVLTRATAVQVRQVAVTENGDDGVYLQGSQSTLKQVRASGNGGYGITLEVPGNGNTVEKCSTAANDGAGIFIDEGSTGNAIQKNVSLANDALDVYDANVSCSNTYAKNVFQTGDVECQ